MPNASIFTIQAQLDMKRLGFGNVFWSPRPEGSSAGGPSAFDDLIEAAGEKHGLDPNLIRAVIRTESNFNPNAVSSAGAKGLMQIMDFNSRAMGVSNPFDPVQNIDAGTRILKGNLEKYGDLGRTLAAYNAGGPTVDRYGGIPPYRETQNYVARVTEALRGYRANPSGTRQA
jgi:soluble lytic murein transglycosylase-like protein